MRPYGIQSKIVRVFVSQAVFISLTTFFGVFASAKIVENVLVKQALEDEAEYFWSLYEKNSNVGMPDTLNLTGYLVVGDDWSHVPDFLRMMLSELGHDYNRINVNDSKPIVYRSSNGDNKLFLLFDEQQVSKLTFFFGTAPLSVVLIVIYLTAWLGYRQSRRAISPVIKLAELVAEFDVQQSTIRLPDLKQVRNTADADVLVLVSALESFTRRLVEFVDRERNFTRDASHELRTPLAVIKGSLSILEDYKDNSSKQEPVLLRIRQTVMDMEGLLETLLILAREPEIQLPDHPVILNDLVKQILEQLNSTENDKNIVVELVEESLLEIKAPEKILAILFSNLIRNALSYTQQGKVCITVKEHGVNIQDSGSGMSKDEVANVFEPFYRAPSNVNNQGYGLGLAIVKRLCNRFNWTIEIQSEVNIGTKVIVQFPQARRISI